jgi:ubiquinone/menaquinone biosynthesis C-methylase UbiE
MLLRTLEPEVMDTDDDARDYDSMDHADVNTQFVQDLVAAGNIGQEVLDVGTGTARIPVEVCLRLATVHIVAVDLAESMLKLARAHLRRAALTGRITIRRADAKRLPFRHNRFTCVMSNSIVHHVPDPRIVFQEAVRVTAPGGMLFFRDLLRPETTERLEQLVAAYAAGANEHQRQLFRNSLHAALRLEEVQQLIGSLGFPAASVQQTSDRHWTWTTGK